MPKSDPYPEIGRILAASTVSPWKTIVLDATVGEDWAKFRAIVRGATGEEQGLSIQQVARLRELFIQLRSTTREVAAPGEPDWTSARFVLQRDGSFQVDFGYSR